MIIDWAVLVGIYVLVLFRSWRKKGFWTWLIRTLLYFYLCVVLHFTLMPILQSIPGVFDRNYRNMAMSPYRDFFNGWGDPEEQIILNIIMMMPFGFLWPFLHRNGASLIVARTVFMTFCLSLGIELLQPLLSDVRVADVTDVINNTLGGLIGAFVYKVFQPFRPKEK